MSLQALIAAVAVALAIGFGSGYYTKGEFVVAAEVTQERKDSRQAATNVVQAIEQSVALDTSIAADGVVIDKIKIAAAARAPKYKPKLELPHASLDPDHNQSTPASEPTLQCNGPGGALLLDVGTVRLLNAARQGANVEPARLGNGQEPAATNPGS